MIKLEKTVVWVRQFLANCRMGTTLYWYCCRMGTTATLVNGYSRRSGSEPKDILQGTKDILFKDRGAASQEGGYNGIKTPPSALIPEIIKRDMQHLKFSNNLYCRSCKQYRAKFTYIKIVGDNINIIFNCDCGEDFQFSMSYEKLREVYYTKDKLSGDLATLWRCFRLGLYFDQVFKHELEKQKYVKLICRLNRDTAGIRDFYYRRKYAN